MARTADGATQLAAVRVALHGHTINSAAVLRGRLLAHRQSPSEVWDLRPATEFGEHDADVDIALCDGAVTSRTAQLHCPEATVVTLVAARDDGQDVITALEAGAHVCVRGDDPTLVAAYLRSIARRRGLLEGTDVQ